LPGHAPGAVDQDVDSADADEELCHGRGHGQVGQVLIDAMDAGGVTPQGVGDARSDPVRRSGDDGRLSSVPDWPTLAVGAVPKRLSWKVP